MAERTKQIPALTRRFDAELRILERQEGQSEGEDRFELSFSSAEPYLRQSWFESDWVEILGHNAGEVRMGRFDTGGMALLLEHDRYTQVGAADSGSIDSKAQKGRAIVRFSRSALGQEIQDDVVRGIRTNVSVRYIIHKRVRIEAGDQEKGIPATWRVTDWEPLEISIVSIPADATVGVGRSKAGDDALYPAVSDDGEPVTEVRTKMDPKEKQEGATATIEVDAAARKQKLNELREMAEKKGQLAEFSRMVSDGLEPSEIATALYKVDNSGKRAQPAPENLLDLNDKERKHYSFARAILASADAARGKKVSGFEVDLSEELEKKVSEIAPNYKRGSGLLVPTRLRKTPKSFDEAMERAIAEAARSAEQLRTLAAGTANAGKETVSTDVGDLIDLLVPRTVCARMGATFMTDLKGNVQLPRQTSDPTMEWIGENPGTTGTESSPGTDQVDLVPHTLRGRTHFTRQFLEQSTIAAELFVRSRLGRAGALTIDKAGLAGTGSANQPKGIYFATGVQVVNADPAAGTTNTVPTYAKLLAMEGLIGDANADQGALGYATTPLMASTLRGILTFPAANTGQAIWQGNNVDGQVAGYRAMASGQMPKTLGSGSDDHGLIFGNWAELVFGLWGVMELGIDPYSLMEQALIRVIFFQLMDIAILHGASFCKMTNAIP